MAERTVRTLIVDDDDDMRFLIRSIIELANEGLQVVGVAEGVADGAAQYRALSPDVVIVDYRMTDGTGVELVERLRADRAEPDVIFCSAYLSDDVRREMDRVGACAVLQKDEIAVIPRAIRECVSH